MANMVQKHRITYGRTTNRDQFLGPDGRISSHCTRFGCTAAGRCHAFVAGCCNGGFHSMGGAGTGSLLGFLGSGGTLWGALSNLCSSSCLGELDSAKSLPSPVISYSLLSLKRMNFFSSRYQMVKRRCSRGKAIRPSSCNNDKLGASGSTRRL